MALKSRILVDYCLCHLQGKLQTIFNDPVHQSVQKNRSKKNIAH